MNTFFSSITTKILNISRNFARLEKLDISETEIESIPAELKALTKIECCSTTILVIPQINDQKKINQLDISETFISLSDDQWKNLVNLTKLNVSDNDLITYNLIFLQN